MKVAIYMNRCLARYPYMNLSAPRMYELMYVPGMVDHSVARKITLNELLNASRRRQK